VSEKRPQIRLTIPVYYELHDLLHDAADCKEDFEDLMKYYTFMDASDIYYTALVLDPRVKGDLLLFEIEGKETGRNILEALRDKLHSKYPEIIELLAITQPQDQHLNKKQKVGSRMLQKQA
jgi:hypothetical protein